MTEIKYATWQEFPGWTRSEAFIKGLVQEGGYKSILEIGAGANPTLGTDYLQSKPGMVYTTNDIDATELAKADPRYRTLLADFTKTKIDLPEKYELIFSKMVNEHVRSGENYYRNIFNCLEPGGTTFHLFSTLYCLPFLINRLVPEFVSSRLLSIFNPRDEFQHAKFKAYYNWSRGPTKAMLNRFESLGFQVKKYNGYFGHPYYRKRVPALHKLEVLKAKILTHTPLPLFTSYAFVELKKPS